MGIPKQKAAKVRGAVRRKAMPRPRAEPIGRPVTRAKPAPRSRDAVIADVSALFKKVDAQMADTFGKTDRPWTWAQNGPFVKLRERMHELKAELQEIAPKAHQDYEYAENVIDELLGAAPNTVPEWSQSGRFIMWAGYIPVVCVWGGYHRARALVLAATPAAPAISKNGFDTISFNRIEKGIKTVRDLFFRALLIGVTGKASEPADIDAVSQEQVSERLDLLGRAWITGAVEGKPNPDLVVPLPPRFSVRPQRMFA
jgi:hypothetical protein